MLKYISLFFITFTSLAQQNPLINDWISTEYFYADGSPIYSQDVLNTSIAFNIKNDSKMLFCTNGKCSEKSYTTNNNTLKVVGNTFKIDSLNNYVLMLTQTNVPDNLKPIRIKFENKKFRDLTLNATSYYSKNNEEVFIRIPNELEPYFMDSQVAAIDYIYEKFRFPTYKKGGFVIRFVITKNGEIKGARVVASSDNSYNNRLIEALSRTKGKWQPGTFNGEPANIEVEYEYNLGYTETNETSVDSITISKELLSAANTAIKADYRKVYNEKITTALKKSINYNPFNIESYYTLSSYLFTYNRKEEACQNLKTLITLDQKLAIKEYDSKCN